ncbi:MAG: hypothetical protein O2904_03910 [bacterium]|nr:hypothetical protein [bacterium]
MAEPPQEGRDHQVFDLGVGDTISVDGTIFHAELDELGDLSVRVDSLSLPEVLHIPVEDSGSEFASDEAA